MYFILHLLQMNVILISGGSGMVGKTLSSLLIKKGYSVSWLTRTIQSDITIPQFEWNPLEKKVDLNAFKNVSAVINLNGSTISDKKWNAVTKKEMYDSRVVSSNYLMECIQLYGENVCTIISSSATGYYGYNTTNKNLTEDSPNGNDFLAKTCVDWEKAIDLSTLDNLRKVIVRTGTVLIKNKGALNKIAPIFKMGLGAELGSGKQFFSWIHIEDLCSIYIKALEDSSIAGIYNAVAPSYTTNHEFTIDLCHTLRVPQWAPSIPAFLLRIILGEMAEMLLYGNKISSKKIIDTGFVFQYPTLKMALSELYK
jgi:uncharacterized protein